MDRRNSYITILKTELLTGFRILSKDQEKQLDTREVNLGGTEIITCAFIPARKKNRVQASKM
jgi:hypothetical protein